MRRDRSRRAPLDCSMIILQSRRARKRSAPTPCSGSAAKLLDGEDQGRRAEWVRPVAPQRVDACEVTIDATLHNGDIEPNRSSLKA